MTAIPATGNEFIDRIAADAIRSQRETGVPASVIIAQAILESGWGRSGLATQGNNFFGIKGTGTAGSVTMPTTEYEGGRRIRINAQFRAYNSPAESFADHGRFFVENRRYASAMQATNDGREFARRIAAAGYATDPNYANQLIGLIDRYKLDQFDAIARGNTPIPAGSSTSAVSNTGQQITTSTQRVKNDYNVRTIPEYKPLGKISDKHPGDIPHPGGKGVINFQVRILDKSGNVVVNFGEFKDLVSWRDSLSVEGASGTWNLQMRAIACNEELLKKVHPGMVIEVYAARNDDPLEGVHANPAEIDPAVTTLEGIVQQVTVASSPTGASTAAGAGGGQQGTGQSTGNWKHPLPGARLTSPFGERIHPITGKRKMHNGIDLAKGGNAKVLATDGGRVSFAKTGHNGGYGNLVKIEHAGGYESRYAHLKSIAVTEGANVSPGQEIGIEGTTGASTGIHLHFEIRLNGKAVDPKPLLGI